LRSKGAAGGGDTSGRICFVLRVYSTPLTADPAEWRVVSGATGVLSVSFGYAGGRPEAGGPGSVVGTTIAAADMIIHVLRAGDFDRDGAAATSIDTIVACDIVRFLDPNNPNCDPFELWLSDFDNDGVPFTTIDLMEDEKQMTILPLYC
jgi:hypothetical protein